MKVVSAWRGATTRAQNFSPPQWLGLIESLMIGLLVLAGLAFIWALAAPTGRGDRRPAGSGAVDMSPSALAAVDPFFRLSGGDSQSMVVTPLSLTLTGVRADRATGRGSAIIGLPDGTQNSYAVGDQIMPGVVLAAVTFDSVTISRNGAPEKLYLDQSDPAPAADVPPPSAAPMGPDPFAAIRAADGPRAPAMRPGIKASLITDVALTPRERGGKVDGYILQPSASGEAFHAAGLRPGDVLVGINGTRFADGVGVQRFAQAIEGIGEARLDLLRDGRPLSLTVGRGE